MTPTTTPANLLAYTGRYQAGRPGLRQVDLDHASSTVTVHSATEAEAKLAAVELARALALIVRERPANGWPQSALPEGLVAKDNSLSRAFPSCHTSAQSASWAETQGGDEEEENWRLLFIFAGVCGGLGLAAWGLEKFSGAPSVFSWALWLASFAAGSWDAAGDAWKAVRRFKPDIHFLMLLAGAAALALRLPAEAVTLMFLFTLATALEHYAEHRTRHETDSLLRHAPREARVILPDGSEAVYPASWLAPGDVMNCPPGDGFAADGIVLAGNSAVDESSLTGEAIPIRKTPGDAIAGGTLNTESALRVKVVRPAADSSAQQIARLVGEARQAKGNTQVIAAVFGDRYTWFLLSACVLCALGWWQLGGLPFWVSGGGTETALYRALALLVAGSPCAIALSAPSALFAAAAGGARQGLLIRNAAALEKLARIRVVALDKTGTVTTGELGLENVLASDPASENASWAAAAALAAGSSHPVSRAVSRLARERKVPDLQAGEARARVGFGVEGSVTNQKVRLGSREFLAEVADEWKLTLPPADHADEDGLVEVWVASPGSWARFQLRDTMRPEAPATIANLRREGLTVVMLTGDRPAAARAMAAKLGLSDIRAGLKPEGKVAAVGELRRTIGKVAMVGDGLNDAPCLAAADVGVAVGGRASEATLAQSDLVLPEGRFDTFERAWRLSRRTHAVLWQNLILACALAATAATASFFGLITLPLAVVAHEGGTVLVCLNSLRLLRKKDEG